MTLGTALALVFSEFCHLASNQCCAGRRRLRLPSRQHLPLLPPARGATQSQKHSAPEKAVSIYRELSHFLNRYEKL
jgi:hypothetical protein